jgi:diacylglycerol O-acyltransferase / wax synthase
MAVVSPLDAMFLLMEAREKPAHVGGMQLFQAPEAAPPDFLSRMYEDAIGSPGEVRSLFTKRPHRAGGFGPWTWQPDDKFDLEYHVRHSALPHPGRIRELLALVSRLHGSLLDRNRPLWEAHLIEGVEDGRFALYSKVHHALLDGASAMRLK